MSDAFTILRAEDITADVFDQFDRKRTGFVSTKRLQEMCRMLGMSITLEEIEDASVILNGSGGGIMSKEDFLRWYEGLSREKQFACTVSQSPNTRLIDARRDRKVTERDAKLLKNRIRMLRREEEKTLRRISHANRQAAKMLDRKSNASNKYEERRMFRKQRQKEIEAYQKQNAIRNELSRVAKLKSSSQVACARLDAAKAVKNVRRELEMRRKQQELESRLRAKSKHDKIVEQRQISKRTKTDRYAQIRKRSELEYLARVVGERKAEHVTQKKLLKMEQNETKMLHRVENARVMQMEALESLSTVVFGNKA